MMNKKINIFLIIAGVLLANLLYASHEIDIIVRPILNIPVITERGAAIEILCDAPPGDVIWYIYLENRITGSHLHRAEFHYSEEDHFWHLTVSISEDIPFELYDLRIRTSNGLNDKVRNAVRVVPEIKDDYYFIHITDTHIPSRQIVLSVPVYSDGNTVEELEELISEFNVINPEFIIHTGDLIDYSAQETQYEIAQDLLATSQIPIFVSAGNNDLKHLTTYPIPGRITWRKFYGRIFDYHFHYGDDFYCGLHAFDSPDPEYSFTSDQLDWLREALNWSNTIGDEMQAIFYHCDMRRFEGDGPQITDAFINDYGVELTMYGHRFENAVGFLGSRSIPDLATSQTCNSNGAFRVIKVSHGQIVSYNLHNYLNFSISYYPPNNGENYEISATVDNNLDEAFDNILVKFFLPRNAVDINLLGGEVLQTIYSDTMITCYVTLDIPPYSSRNLYIGSTANISGNATTIKPNDIQIRSYPNPFNEMVTIIVQGPASQLKKLISVELYDIQGNQIRAFPVNMNVTESILKFQWNGRDNHKIKSPSGVYFISLDSGAAQVISKLILLR